MCCNNIKTQFSFSIYFFKTLNLIRNSFLRCQHSYFALANIWLYRYDSPFQFHLLLLGVIYCSTVNNYTVPLHTLPSNNYNEPAMPTEYNSFDCCRRTTIPNRRFFKKVLTYFKFEYRKSTSHKTCKLNLN